MAERKYSVSEIDRMRRALMWSVVGPSDPVGVEERLRTYMLNGTDPEELEEAARERDRKMRERFGDMKPGDCRVVSQWGQ